MKGTVVVAVGGCVRLSVSAFLSPVVGRAEIVSSLGLLVGKPFSVQGLAVSDFSVPSFIHTFSAGSNQLLQRRN